MKIREVNLGVFILNLLNERGISKGEFADTLGIKRQNVNRDVFDKKSLDTNLVRRISEYFDYNLFSLFVVDNQNDYSIPKEMKATVVIEIGNKKKDVTFGVRFGDNDIEILNK
jgi:plasmid maintenance system antidote protein VapI